MASEIVAMAIQNDVHTGFRLAYFSLHETPDQSFSRLTSSLSGCLEKASLSICNVMGKSKDVPVIMQQPLDKLGIKLLDRLSRVLDCII